MTEMSRDEHLAWCKRRALEYLEQGDLLNAVASMGSDLGKHQETRPNPGLVVLALMYAEAGNAQAVRHWIEGFR